MTGKLGLLAAELAALGRAIVIGWPTNVLGGILRSAYYRRRLGARLGAGAQIGMGAIIADHPNLRIGNQFVAGKNVHIIADISLGIRMGDNVALAHGVYVRGSNHAYGDLDRPMMGQGHFARRIATADGEYSVVIEDDVMVGAYAVILSGAHIGRGSIIASGAVVASQVPEYSIVAGNPGRVVGNRATSPFSQDVVGFDAHGSRLA